MDTYEAVMQSGSHFKDARRKQESLLASGEKRALVWIAQRMPRWINSDHLTIIGSLGMVLTGVSYALARWNKYAVLLATLFLFVNWFGDSLDGTLARVRSRLRPRYGFYVDHVTDSLGTAVLFGGLGFSGLMSPTIAVALLIAFLLLSIEVYLATYTLGSFRLSHFKWSPTELRILLAIGNVVVLFHPVVLGNRYLLFDVGGVVGTLGMLLIMLISFVRNTRTLYREERLP
ncbi:MAG TPA: CDP-alcohol phosphatidyltransferase family protein [Terriglobales bacterium]|nr:CDP-alcohol phosphatidyltransferase family protein [Terriglobales bacterium]